MASFHHRILIKLCLCSENPASYNSLMEDLSFSEWNSVESIESTVFVENYYYFINSVEY